MTDKAHLDELSFLHSRGGILPEGHAAMHHRDQLRRERQAEYQAYLNHHHSSNTATGTLDRGNVNRSSPRGNMIPSSTSSSLLAEKRRALARERDCELVSTPSQDRPPHPYHYTSSPDKYAPRERGETENRRDHMGSTTDRRGAVNGSGQHWRDRQYGDDHSRFNLPSNRYDHQREERIEEEKRYNGQYGGDIYQHRGAGVGRGRRDEESQDNDGGGGGLRQVHFERNSEDNVERIDLHGPSTRHNTRKQWDEEEEGLIQWARGQGKSVGPSSSKISRASIPPSSSHRNDKRGGSRSLSAPVVGGIANLGAGSDESDKKRKQREYAEQLRAQMREKQTAKEREREGRASDSLPAVSYRRSEDSRRSPATNHVTSSLQHTVESKSSPRRDYPRRHDRDRVHFSPRSTERDSRHHHTRYSSPPNNHYETSSKTVNPPYWPGLYYGGFPYPPPSNFPHPPPPPPSGLPFYPPPPSLPPSLSNPYLAPYYPSHPAAGGFEPESRRGTNHDQNGSSSLQRVKEGGEKFSLPGSSGGGEGAKVSKDAYRAQLMDQMREKQETRRRENLEKNEFDHRKEQEIYDPFGKGGCGAPIRDRRGQLVTDLKHMKKVNDERMIIGLPSTTPLPGEVAEGGAAGVLENSLTEHTSPLTSYDVRRSKELQSKMLQEGYKEVLERQMREKEELKRKEKEESERTEQMEAERIHKELKMLEEKYKHEKEREKEKQYELKMKNEAMKREKEEKEREELERKTEEERCSQEMLRLEAEQKKQMLIDNMERQLPPQNHVRSNSPPIPTLRKLNPQFAGYPTVPNTQQQQQRSASPPVPTISHKLLIGGTGNPPPDKRDHGSAHNAAVPQPSIQQQQDQRQKPGSPAAASVLGNSQPVMRSSSACAAIQANTTSTDGDSGGGGGDGGRTTVHVLSPSRSAHQLPRTSIAPTLIPTSTSNPNPSSSTIPEPISTQPPVPVEEDKMERMLKNLRSMRQMLESERQKVTIHKQPDPVTTVGFAGASPHTRAPGDTTDTRAGGKPEFWKPRLAAPRKSGNPASNAPSNKNTQQQQQQQQGEHRQRKQWQPTFTEPHGVPQSSHDHCVNTQAPGHFTGSAGKEGSLTSKDTAINPHFCDRGDAVRRKTPPMWLRPRGPDLAVGGGRGPPLDTNSYVNRAPSVGGQSQFSITTLDVDSMARRNEERMQRLESILNTQARDSRSPQTVISDFLTRNSRAKDATRSNSTHRAATQPPITTAHTHRASERPQGLGSDFVSAPSGTSSRLSQRSHELDCETSYQPVAASTPT